MRTEHDINGVKVWVNGWVCQDCTRYHVGIGENWKHAIYNPIGKGSIEIEHADVGITDEQIKSAVMAHRSDIHKEALKRKRNAAKRAENQALRDMCGTSARAAREDMGL